MIKSCLKNVSLYLILLYCVNMNAFQISNNRLVTKQIHYTASNGLVTDCLGNGFIDSKGRQWLNPCKEKAEMFSHSFFQFDGEQSIFYDLRPEWLDSNTLTPIWHILGLNDLGFIYGADIDNGILFYWNPDTDLKYFFQLNSDEKIINLKAGSDGSFVALLFNSKSVDSEEQQDYKLVKFKNNRREDIAKVTFNFEDDIMPYESHDRSFPFEVTENSAWFFHQRKGLVEVDLSTGKSHLLEWSSFKHIPSILKYHTDVVKLESFNKFQLESIQWKIIAMNSNQLLLFLGMQNGFFTLNIETEELIPHKTINEFFNEAEIEKNLFLNRTEQEGIYGDILNVRFAKDINENILISGLIHEPWSNKTYIESLKGLLVNAEGEYADYTPILKEIDRKENINFLESGNFFSDNFIFQLGSSAIHYGVVYSDLQPNLGLKIKKINRPYVLGQISSISDSTLLVNSQFQVFRLNLDQDLKIEESGWNRLTQWWVLALKQYSSIVHNDNKIWGAARYHHVEARQGLQWYDPKTNENDYIRTPIDFEKFDFVKDEEAILFEDHLDMNRIGDTYIFNLKTKTLRPFLNNGTPFSVNAKVNDLLQTDSLKIWIGARNGLWQLDLSQDKAFYFDSLELLKHKNILSIHEVDDQTLWLGTANSGIIVLNHVSNHAFQISEAQGLSNNTVLGTLQDDAGNYWVSTYNGITVLDANANVRFVINESHGLSNNRFNLQSYYKLPDGTLVFGGMKGLNFINPINMLKALSEKEVNKIYLTELRYWDATKNENITYKGEYNSSTPISISAGQRYLSLDFAMSNYANLSEQSFAYRLVPEEGGEEIDSNDLWINIGAESRVTISNIPPGDYLVEVKGSDYSSNLLEATLFVPIHVSEYFYKQWWFYLLCALPFVLGIWIWMKRIDTENKRLEVEVSVRTTQILDDKKIIQQQANDLLELDKSKTRFFTNISHEFRTPLTVISGLVNQTKADESIKVVIQRNIKILLHLINQILDLRKLESGNISARMIQGDLTEYMRYTVESFRSLADEKGVQLSFENSNKVLVLDYDPENLLHIVSNLVANAIKFTPKDGSVKVSLNLISKSEIDFYRLSVSDSGIGIPEEKIQHVFDRFYQVDDEHSRTGSGTGIGLTLVKELVNLLNGEINVTSKPNEGTQFWVEFPVTKKADIQKAGDSDKVEFSSVETYSLNDQYANNISDDDADKPKLLLVEDNPDVMNYLESCLQKEYYLIKAIDGYQGVAIAQEQMPDIIISDVMMPKLDGLELCNRLKLNLPTSHIPIVLLTAKADLESRIEGLKRGADAYIAKPFEPEELLVRLKNLLALRNKLRIRYSNLNELEPTQDSDIKIEDEFILRLKKVILEHMREEFFGVTTLCEKMFVSRTQLHHKIKALTNKSTSEFIRNVRIQQACIILKNPDFNISEVGYEIGILSRPYFTKLFTTEMGMSPTNYRNKLD